MRIGIVTTQGPFVWGGSEELWYVTAKAARGAGHAVCVSLAELSRGYPKVDELQQLGVELCFRSLPLPPSRGLAQRIVRFAKGRTVDRFAPPAERVDPAWQRFFAFDPQTVFLSFGWTYHYYYDPTFAPFLLHQKSNPLPHVIVCHGGNETDLPSPELGQRTREVLSGAYRAGFVSQRNCQIIERQLTSKLENAIVVRNPVNVARAGVVDWPADQTTVRLACVSRLDAGVKGFDMLLELLSTAAWRDRNWLLTFYGEGPSRDYLQRLVAFYHLGENVEFAGHVHDIRQVWEQNHLLLMPSRSEAMPLALVEAMLCGRPSVVTDVGGVTELVAEPQNAFVAEAATLRAYGDAMDRAWAAKGSWPDMGRSAYERAMNWVDPTPGESMLKILVEAARHGAGNAAQ